MNMHAVAAGKVRWASRGLSCLPLLGLCWLTGCQSVPDQAPSATSSTLLDAVGSRVTVLAREAREGDKEAARRYGVLLAQTGQWTQAEALLSPLAQQGNKEAQLALARLLLQQGDMQAGARMMQQAAEKNLPEAQRHLARLYARGHGVPRDDRQAFVWDMKAAQQGDREAQNNVGAAYSRGQGVSASPVRAFDWYQRAALQGYTRAQFNLAGAWLTGTGTPRNAGEAYAWYSTVVACSEGTLKQAARQLQLQAWRQVARTGRTTQAQALADARLQRYTPGNE
jgi:hypothetical protein